jgi:serine/threonine protein kinase
MIFSSVRFLNYLLSAVGADFQRALVLLYLAGWTHGDISPGNIIIVEKGGRVRGKLSDLEYAKAFTDTKFSADPKTVCFPYILLPSLM